MRQAHQPASCVWFGLLRTQLVCCRCILVRENDPTSIVKRRSEPAPLFHLACSLFSVRSDWESVGFRAGADSSALAGGLAAQA